MRFFKAFNILHRRVKSATFVPGPPFDSNPTKLRASSVSGGGAPTLFDLITSRPPSIPDNFNHVRDGPDPERIAGPWRRHQRSGKAPAASLQPEIEQEQLRLRDSVNFWIHEHSKLQEILRKLEENLLLERRKVAALEHMIDADMQEKLELHTRYENLFGKSQNTANPTQDQVLSIPASSKTRHSFKPSVLQTSHEQSVKLRSLDEYSSALRMTLTTRRRLRDQKKVTNFWKRQAISGGEQSIVTPSVSSLSSLHEILPVERQAALDALVSRLGLTSKLAKIHAEDSPYPSRIIDVPPLSDVRLPSLISTLPSFSRSSGTSRLGPLASESMKMEISLMFGSNDKSRGTSLATRDPSHDVNLLEPAKYLKKESRASVSNQIIDIDSFSDLNLVFERAFGTEVNQETDGMTYLNATAWSSALPWSNSLLPVSSSSRAPISSIPSGTSQTFVNASHGLKEGSTPRKSAGVNRQQRSTQRKATKEKENIGFSISLPVFKRRHSRLPVPVFMKRDVS